MSTKPSRPPPRISLREVNKYLNLVEAPKVENRRLLALLIATVVALVLLSIGMLRMLPLKERVPYVVQVEMDTAGRKTGNVTVKEGGIERFTVSEANIRYFLGKWAINLLSLDERSKEIRLPESYSLLRGDALKDWTRYITETSRPLEKMVEDPMLRQRAEIISMVFLSEKTVMIRVQLTNNRNPRNNKRVQITLNFALLPPETEQDVYRNPIGLWITTFGVNDELV